MANKNSLTTYAGPAATTMIVKLWRPRGLSRAGLLSAGHMPLTGTVTLALDAMGGDGAPRQVIQGMDIARERYPNLEFIVFGDENQIEPLIRRQSRLVDCCEIRHTLDAIADTDKPSQALRRGTNSSMRLAIDAVRAGDAQGVISAGNTGALLAVAKFVLKTLPGISRPAFASFFPTVKGESVMLDLGANIECDADNLVQFAVMGTAFSRAVIGVERPRVALLNVGAEELKGHEALKGAAERLRAVDSPAMEFLGYVEGDDIPAGTADVVVTDGFTGNVALKTAEGTAKLIITFLRGAFRRSLMSRLGYLLARGAIAALRERIDPRIYNGAMFVGLNGIVVKSHGGADAMGFASAIGVAHDMVHGKISDRIIEELQRLDSLGGQALEQAAAVS